MGKQRILECAAPVPRRWMDHQPRRLVENDQRFILMDDIQRKGLSAHFGQRFKRDLKLDGFTAMGLVAGFGEYAVDLNLPLSDPFGDPASGIVRQQLTHGLVKPKAPQMVRNLEAKGLRAFHATDAATIHVILKGCGNRP